MKCWKVSWLIYHSIVWIALTSHPQVHAQSSHPDFTGVWSGNFTTKDSDFWQIEDFTACFAGCSPTVRQYLAGLIEDSANDDRPIQELVGEAIGFARAELASKSTPEGLALQEANTLANDTVLDCKPYGLVRLATNPITMAIHLKSNDLYGWT